MESLQKLLLGNFSKSLGDLFTAQGKGLFPSPKEIRFSCSCPDWASMCKHVAATLYGIGARLDEEPGLFFKLRKVDMNDLISQAVEDQTKKLLDKARKRSDRIIDDADLGAVFGIDFEHDGNGGFEATEVIPTPPNKKTKKTTQQLDKKVLKQSKSRAGKSRRITATDVVWKVIQRSRSKKGIDTFALKMKTGLPEKTIRSAVAGLKKKGAIKVVQRGYYIKA